MKAIHIHVIHVGRSLGGWGMVISNLPMVHILSYAIGNPSAWGGPNAKRTVVDTLGAPGKG
jgi:hypothetical protein